MGRGRRKKEREEERERERKGGSIDLVARMKREAESEVGYSQARPLVSINYRPLPYKAIIKSREHVVLHTRVSVTSDLRVTHGRFAVDRDDVFRSPPGCVCKTISPPDLQISNSLSFFSYE